MDTNKATAFGFGLDQGGLCLSDEEDWFNLVSQWFPTLSVHQNHPEGLPKCRRGAFLPRISDSVGLGLVDLSFAFLTSFQVILMLMLTPLVWGLQFENHCCG